MDYFQYLTRASVSNDTLEQFLYASICQLFNIMFVKRISLSLSLSQLVLFLVSHVTVSVTSWKFIWIAHLHCFPIPCMLDLRDNPQVIEECNCFALVRSSCDETSWTWISAWFLSPEPIHRSVSPRLWNVGEKVNRQHNNISRSINEYSMLQSDIHSGGAIWWMLTGWRPDVVDWGGAVFAGCLPWVQLFVSACDGRPH